LLGGDGPALAATLLLLSHLTLLQAVSAWYTVTTTTQHNMTSQIVSESCAIFSCAVNYGSSIHSLQAEGQMKKFYQELS
jgi:hypothetical protein